MLLLARKDVLEQNSVYTIILSEYARFLYDIHRIPHIHLVHADHIADVLAKTSVRITLVIELNTSDGT